MATEVAKNLGQVVAAATDTAFVSCPSGKEQRISSLVLANTHSAAVTFRLRHAIDDAGVVVQQYLYYDVSVGVGKSFAATLLLTLDALDKLYVVCSVASVLACNAYGVEVTP